MRMSRQFEEQSIEAIDPLETMPPAKKSMVIFFLVDTSKSMEGSKLESLNRVMGDILPELIGVGEAGTDVKVAVMSFSSGCEFTDDEELVLQACGAEMLKKLVREIAVTSSKIGSTSMTLTDATGERSLAEVAGAKKEQMIEAVQEMKQDIMGVDDLTDLGDMDIEFDEGW